MTDRIEDLEAEVAPSVDPTLLEFASPRQSDAIKAVIATGSVNAASAKLGMTPRALRGHLSEARRRAAARGYSPAHDMTRQTAPGYLVKGTSTYYRVNPETGESEISGQWVKTKKDEESRLAELLDAIQDIAEPWRGLAPTIASPDHSDDDLLAVYPMGDPHFGMYAWHEETGNNFDLKIAEATLLGAVDELVEVAPAASTALILPLGDFSHADNYLNRTMKSGHPLDVDGRWPLVLRIMIRAMRRTIERALSKHQRVHVIVEIGNHDEHTSIALALALNEFYSDESRVTIDTSPDKFHWFRFGKVLIGTTHGDTVKPADLLKVMSHDRREDWGQTEFHHWYTGHVHHESVREYGSMLVETFRTLAARDKYSHSHGYRSGRDMKCDVWHRNYGRVERREVSLARLLAKGYEA